jgi:diadenosine tetraphosphate (Ap4A) HIT family hydrolase
MASIISDWVFQAREGRNPAVICRMKSGWAMMGTVQPLEGYCVLLADPMVDGLNSMPESARADYLLDMVRIGDAVLKATDAYRINYETLCNLEPFLHSHILPRYRSESDDKRTLPPFVAYDWKLARKFDAGRDEPFLQAMREFLKPFTVLIADRSSVSESGRISD